MGLEAAYNRTALIIKFGPIVKRRDQASAGFILLMDRPPEEIS